jgi:hypothetical protein
MKEWHTFGICRPNSVASSRQAEQHPAHGYKIGKHVAQQQPTMAAANKEALKPATSLPAIAARKQRNATPTDARVANSAVSQSAPW